ncbi:hypothetical protein [Micromonospora maritima]|uniref:hypothetical protein n=1 Tax=Micromonospora maritima TaxID=986711 RepID=UPI003797DED4
MSKRAFISFDYDYDKFLKDALVGQAKHPDSPFEIHDWSIKVASRDWQVKARARIRASDVVPVICGLYTDIAVGVSKEIEIARAEGIPYFLLQGYKSGNGKRPASAKSTDKIYTWTWDNLKALIGGAR